MALAVAEAIRDNAILVAEAGTGTGTGKPFAYIIPALLKGRADYVCRLWSGVRAI